MKALIKKLDDILCSIGKDPTEYLIGWAVGLIGAILGTIIGKLLLG